YDAYSASKAGVYGLVRVLAADYAPSIRVNGVVPGYTETPMTSWVTPAEHEALLQTIPMRRAGRAEEVAAVMSFLASDEASYTTEPQTTKLRPWVDEPHRHALALRVLVCAGRAAA